MHSAAIEVARAAMSCAGLHMQWRARRALLHTALLCVVLLVASVASTAAAAVPTASSTGPIEITPTNAANPSRYYATLRSQDATIFAGSSTVASTDQVGNSQLDTVEGLRTLFPIPDAPSWLNTNNQSNTAAAAVRADVVSELFVTMALLYLDSNGTLPFARTAPIPATYLPPSYTGGAVFVNPAFPAIPITLNMLLQHVSSVTEVGFELGDATGPTGTAPSLSAFVSELFSTAGTRLFSANQPGLATTYTYSRSNTAIVSYVVERVLAGSTNYATFTTIGDFVFSVVLPPLQLVSTFLLNPSGRVIDTAYPRSSTNTRNVLGFRARQDIAAGGTGILATYPIHASYFSDYMLFTSGADLARLVRGVLVPGGPYYDTIGALMLQNVVPVSQSTMLYTTARTTGLYLFDANQLCSIMYAAVAFSGAAPYCHYTNNTVSAVAPPFGLVATGGVNELAIVCVPVVGSRKTFCTVAELSFYDAGWRSGDAAVAGNRAVGLAMVSLSYLSSEPMPTTPAPTSPPNAYRLNGWFVFVGVLAALVVVVVAAYVTDYLIQPPPPAQIVAPAVTGQVGWRSGTAPAAPGTGSSSSGGGGGGPAANDVDHDGGGSDEPVDDDDELPKSIRPRSAALPGATGTQHRRWRSGAAHPRDDDDDDNGDDFDTPYVLRGDGGGGGGPLHGGSSMRRRHQRPQQQQQQQQQQRRHGSVNLYGADERASYSGDDLDDTDRSSTGSQRPNPHGVLRFDAYI